MSGILDTPADPAFDDLVVVVAQVARADVVGCVFVDGDRRWCKAAAGIARQDWALAEADRPAVARVAVSAPDGSEIGELVVLGGEGDVAAGTLDTLAGLVGVLLDERRPGAPSRPGPFHAVVVDTDGRFRAIGPGLARLMGREDADVLGTSVFDHVHADDHALAVDSLARTAAFPGEKYPLDLRFLHADGSTRLLEVTAETRVDPLLDDVVFVVREPTARTDSDAFITDQTLLLAMIARGAPIVDTLSELVTVVSRHLSTASCVMLLDDDEPSLRPIASQGLTRALLEEIDGAPVGDGSITCGVVAHRNQAVRCPDISADPAWSAPARAAAADAGITSCWSTPIRSSVTSGAIGTVALYLPTSVPPTPQQIRLADLCAGLAGVAVQRAVAEDDLTYRAMHDPLTGLANRALFLDRLTHALSLRPDDSRYTAVMFLDLDRFKVVNDALGHDAGDELLIAVADRLRSVCRPSATVARFGGDEFTVLCENLRTPRDAAAIATRLVEALREPLALSTGDIAMSMSVGVAVSNDPTDLPATLLRDADSAMYRAKERGRNRVEVFDETMRAVALARLDLEHALKDSVERRGDFTLLFQPEVELRQGEVIAAEALLRWAHPDHGTVAPCDFIPMAEETGAIIPLGDWVLAEVCERARDWTKDMHPSRPFTVWANISVVQLLQPGFPDRVRQILEATGTQSARLGLEITESALMTDADAAIACLAELRSLGVSLAIDDFGTGYSSLSYLKTMPVHIVKIDRSFVKDIDDGDAGTALVSAIVHLAHAVGCQVVAEGVETVRQYETLAALGCDIAQGYRIGVPEPVLGATPAWL